MKIEINRIPQEGLILTGEISSSELELDTELIHFRAPLRIKAEVSRITNAVTARLQITGLMSVVCSRCLGDFESSLKRDIEFNYPVDKGTQTINLNPDIREELIVDYPMKPLCVQNCKGLCPKCGKNLNEGGCSCGST